MLTDSRTSGFACVPRVPRASRTCSCVRVAAGGAVRKATFRAVPHFIGTPVITSVSSGVLSGHCSIGSFKLVCTKTRGGVKPTKLAVIVIGRSLVRARGTLPDVLSCHARVGGSSLCGAPPDFSVCMTGLIFR